MVPYRGARHLFQFLEEVLDKDQPIRHRSAAEQDAMNNIRGVLLDLDGTLYEDQRALPRAVEAVRQLRHAGLRVRFLSNTSRRPRRAVFVGLQGMGFTDEVSEVQTAPAVAAAWLATRGIRRVALLVANETREDFPGLEFDEMAPGGRRRR